MAICRNCGAQLQASFQFCDKCGVKIIPCKNCGQPLAPDASFCGNCGFPAKNIISAQQEIPIIPQPKHTGDKKIPFVKATPLRPNNIESLFNTDMIVKINRRKDCYRIFFSSGNEGAAIYDFDEANAKIFFDAIGMWL